jgi:hypothetical protein
MSLLICGCCTRPLTRIGTRLVCPLTAPAMAAAVAPKPKARRAETYAGPGIPVPPVRRTLAPQIAPPIEWTGMEPPLILPEWEPLGAAELTPSEASRNIVVLGQTGAGKTASAVAVFARAALRYPARPGERVDADHPLCASMLLIDAKDELGDAVMEWSSHEGPARELIRLRPAVGDWMIWLWDDVDPLDLSGEDVAGRILAISSDYMYQRGHTREAYFVLQAERFVESLFAVDLALYRIGGTEWVRSFWRQLAARALKQGGAWIPPDDFLRRPLALLSAQMHDSGALRLHSDLARSYGVPESLLSAVVNLGELAQDTYSSVVSTLLAMIKDLANDRFLKHVGVDPFVPPAEHLRVCARDALESGQAVIYSPGSQSAPDTAIGRALKSRFFAGVFSRRNRERPFYYLCDEAHRYITTDATGEHHLLDRGRAYRASCLLATQSLASFRHAIASGASNQGGEAALDILMANASTQLYFRCTDLEARDRLRRLLPDSQTPGRPHVVDARPPSTLAVGECYYMRASGAWGRTRIRLRGD